MISRRLFIIGLMAVLCLSLSGVPFQAHATAVTSKAALVSALTGATAGSFPALDSNLSGESLSTAVPDGSGGWFIGGDFTTVGNVTRNKIAHVFANGIVDPSWDPNVGDTWEVSTLTLSGTTLYVGGEFETIGGQSRTNLAAIDTTTGLATSWNPGGTNAGGRVDQIIISGSTAYIRGVFNKVNGVARDGLAAIDTSTGALLPWNPAVQGWVSMAISNGNIIVCNTSQVYALEPTTASVLWSTNLSNSNFFTSIAATDSVVYVGGWFSTLQGQSRHIIGALSSVNGALLPWYPSILGDARAGDSGQDQVSKISIYGNTIYVAGTFLSANGKPRMEIAAFDGATAAVTSWNPNANRFADITAIASDGTNVLLGGSFSSVGVPPAKDIFVPAITNISVSKGVYRYSSGLFMASLQPFSSYTGSLWAKKVDFGINKIYIFAPTSAYKNGTVKVYDSNYKLIQTIKPFGAIFKNGVIADIVVEPLNNKVYVSFGYKKGGFTAKVYEVTEKGFIPVTNVAAGTSKSSGSMAPKFLKLYSSQYGLVTMLNGNPKTLKVWKYSAAKKQFIQDKGTVIKKIKVVQGMAFLK